MFVHVDVDECQSENGGCEQNCTNTVGSFFCNCSDGFRLREDLLQCDGKFKITAKVFPYGIEFTDYVLRTEYAKFHS